MWNYRIILDTGGEMEIEADNDEQAREQAEDVLVSEGWNGIRIVSIQCINELKYGG